MKLNIAAWRSRAAFCCAPIPGLEIIHTISDDLLINNETDNKVILGTAKHVTRATKRGTQAIDDMWWLVRPRRWLLVPDVDLSLSPDMYVDWGAGPVFVR